MTSMHESLNQAWDLVFEGDLAAVEGFFSANASLLHEFAPASKQSWLNLAASQGHMHLVRYFHSLGLPLDSVDEFTECPLSRLVSLNDTEGVQWLLDAGADANFHHAPMISAVTTGNVDIVKMLVERGAETEFTFGEPLRTPLEQAMEFRNQEVVEYLQALGASSQSSVLASEEDKQFDSKAGIKDALEKFGEKELRGEIVAYFEYHFDRTADSFALQEIVPGDVELRVHTIVSGNPKEPTIIFTTGLSLMGIASGESSSCAECCMYLPPHWELSKQLWPLAWLRTIALYAATNKILLNDEPTTYANGLLPEPLDASSEFKGFLLIPNFGALAGFESELEKFINIITIVPIYSEELMLAGQPNGIAKLFARFQENGIKATLLPGRKNVAVTSAKY